MKSIQFIIVFLIISTIVKGQTNKSFKVSLVKERPEIDVMVQEFKKYNKKNGYKNDSCFIIAIYRKNKEALFAIHFLDSVFPKKIYTDQPDIFKKNNFRYFKFRNNFVLIYGDDDPYGLLKMISARQVLNITLTPEIEGFTRKDSGYLYVYKNGRFKVLGDMSH